ncbi:MAG TPA: AfsR/SARP family transcriptional regulator [Solirubrobacteraceae bacterium]|nr:AfsR/SARP family transcriptional regulator [Solirubrobacteraceae bacterium]
MDFRLLGPLEVSEQHRAIALGGLKQRSLLAVLLLRANEIVATDRLVADVWGESPPATVAKSIQSYVWRLRRELGADRLTTRAPGYVLHVAPQELDLAVFERLRAEARRAEPARAADKLRAALALWRGPPLADFAYEPFAQTEILRLEEMRLATLEERVDADLACGRHGDVVGELEALAAAHPLRERLRAQLMVALYRSGRQAEALQVYRAARRELAEELGLEPGEELRRLERAILAQDPELGAAPPPPQAPPETERSLLVFPRADDALEGLLPLAAALAGGRPPRELILARVVQASDVGTASRALADRAEELRGRGTAARAAAFSSPTPGRDVARLAAQQDVDLLLMDAGAAPLEGEAGAVLEDAPCDVALLIGTLRPGPVVVPFGAAHHDWAALELGTAVAAATGASLRLVGAASDNRPDGRDASRLLADASLLVQRRAGVVAEPLLGRPGHDGIFGLARDAGLLVVGLSDRWREEGLGEIRSRLAAASPAPTVLVRRGAARAGLAPNDPRTLFRWSLIEAGT